MQATSSVKTPRAHAAPISRRDDPGLDPARLGLIWIAEVDDAVRRDTAFFCPGCGGLMHAVLHGKEPHFRHAPGERPCAYARESALHLSAKIHFHATLSAMIGNASAVFVGHVDQVPCRMRRSDHRFARRITGAEIVSVRMEAHQLFRDRLTARGRPESFRPDILVTLTEGRRVFVEVMVTSACSEAKIATGVPILEIRLHDWDYEGLGFDDRRFARRNFEALFPDEAAEACPCEGRVETFEESWRPEAFKPSTIRRPAPPIERPPQWDPSKSYGARVDRARKRLSGLSWRCPGCGGEMQATFPMGRPRIEHRGAACGLKGPPALLAAAKAHFGFLLEEMRQSGRPILSRGVYALRIREIRLAPDVPLVNRIRNRIHSGTYAPDILVTLEGGARINVDVRVTQICGHPKRPEGAAVMEIDVNDEDFLIVEDFEDPAWSRFHVREKPGCARPPERG
jgi:hypothetical protein